MAKPTGGLGRGLDALIPQQIAPDPGSEAAEIASSAVSEVPPGRIETNPHQPRTDFSPTELEDLLASIQEHGILQPLVVTERGDGMYELIAGERRLRAAKMLELPAVPVVIRDATEQQKLELALIENIQRQSLNVVEEAKAYQSLADMFSLTQEEVAQRVGKSRSTIANTIRLLELEHDILDALAEGRLSRSHARTLLGERDPEARKTLFERMMQGEMTVREAEAQAAPASRRRVRRTPADQDPNLLALEDELREALGTKVKLQMKGGKGKVVIHVFSKEDLKQLLDTLTGNV